MPDVVLPVLNEAGALPWVLGGMGRQLRDFVHVRDVARANVLALTTDPPVMGASNIASGTPRTVLEMAETLAGAFGPAAPGPVVTGEYRLGDVRHVFASPVLPANDWGSRRGWPSRSGCGSSPGPRFGRPRAGRPDEDS
ncbi:MAG: NAD-dependent epimerase/dehydratase family protein [Actinomycetota bacterium]